MNLKHLFQYGHHLNPHFRLRTDIKDEADLTKLDKNHEFAQNMIASWQEMMSDSNGDSLLPDGEWGPKTESSLEVQRCGYPDYQAAGGGTFNNPCYTDGIRFSVNSRRRPNSISEQDADQMVASVVSSWGSIGARMIQVDVGASAEIEVLWEPLRGSTIGLAQLTGGSCGSKLFCKLDPNYGSAGLVQNTYLLLHETGHNFGLRHTNSGVMAPSIERNNVFNGWERRDPSYRTLKRQWGWEPINTPFPPDIKEDKLKLVVNDRLVDAIYDGASVGSFLPIVRNGRLVELRSWVSV